MNPFLLLQYFYMHVYSMLMDMHLIEKHSVHNHLYLAVNSILRRDEWARKHALFYPSPFQLSTNAGQQISRSSFARSFASQTTESNKSKKTQVFPSRLQFNENHPHFSKLIWSYTNLPDGIDMSVTTLSLISGYTELDLYCSWVLTCLSDVHKYFRIQEMIYSIYNFNELDSWFLPKLYGLWRINLNGDCATSEKFIVFFTGVRLHVHILPMCYKKQFVLVINRALDGFVFLNINCANLVHDLRHIQMWNMCIHYVIMFQCPF